MFIAGGCIPKESRLSYHTWCWAQFNPLSTTYFYDQSLVCENQVHYEDMQKKHFTSPKFENIQRLQSLSCQIGATSEILVFFSSSKFGWQDGWGKNESNIHTHTHT